MTIFHTGNKSEATGILPTKKMKPEIPDTGRGGTSHRQRLRHQKLFMNHSKAAHVYHRSSCASSHLWQPPGKVCPAPLGSSAFQTGGLNSFSSTPASLRNPVHISGSRRSFQTPQCLPDPAPQGVIRNSQSWKTFKNLQFPCTLQRRNNFSIY